jgi:hypothetical protein
MNGRRRHGRNWMADRHKSRFGDDANSAEILGIPTMPLGQSYPQHYPHSESMPSRLGEPMDIEDVAELLGCSVWTVRQRYLPGGLPHIRASARGRFVFFHKQVVDWILKRQKGKEVVKK